MRNLFVCAFVVCVFGLGYLCGTNGVGSPQPLKAAQDETPISSETLAAYKKARTAVNDLADSMTAESRYVSAADTPNYFALSVGGIDTISDLEEGRGVDPETFAALYAGRASPEVAPNLDEDANGRIRYKGTVIRMYSRERLKNAFQHRDDLVNRSGGLSN